VVEVDVEVGGVVVIRVVAGMVARIEGLALGLG